MLPYASRTSSAVPAVMDGGLYKAVNANAKRMVFFSGHRRPSFTLRLGSLVAMVWTGLKGASSVKAAFVRLIKAAWRICSDPHMSPTYYLGYRCAWQASTVMAEHMCDTLDKQWQASTVMAERVSYTLDKQMC